MYFREQTAVERRQRAFDGIKVVKERVSNEEKDQVL
jgi:hypothetical protein